MEKFNALMEKYLLPVAARIGGQRHLVAIRDGFILTIALIIAGSLAVLLNNLPIPVYQNAMTAVFGADWKSVGGNIWWATFALNSIFITLAVAYSLAKSYGEEGIGAGIVSLACFFMFAPQSTKYSFKYIIENGQIVASDASNALEYSGSAWGVLPWSYTSQVALFTAIIIAIVATEMFTRLSKSDKLTINMPEGVPPAVARSFAKLLPGLITLLVMSLASVIISKVSGGEFLNDIINKFVARPLQAMTDSLGSALFIPFINQLFWFFGLHGSNILTPFIGVTLGPLLEFNMVAYQNGAAIPHVVAGPFLDAFVYLGGSGSTAGLLVAIFLASKSKHHRTIANLGAAPGIFQINEPVIFGMPLVLNPVFIIPFILTPVILSGISYAAISSGLVHPVVATMPWTTPPVIGGFLATGGHVSGALLAAFNLVLSIIIYLPFVKIAGAQEEKEAEEELHHSEK